MNYPLFIARKIYNGGERTRKVSKPAIRIATIGVAIGLAVMIISVGVVLGFWKFWVHFHDTRGYKSFVANFSDFNDFVKFELWLNEFFFCN